MKVINLIATRYLFSNVITLFAMSSIILCVAILSTVLAVINGFQNNIYDQLKQQFPHILVRNFNNNAQLKKINITLNSIAKQNNLHLNHLSLINESALLKNTQNIPFLVNVTGINSKEILQCNKYYSSSFCQEIPKLNYKNNKYNMIIDFKLAEHLNINIGDKITLIAPQLYLDILGSGFRNKRFNVAGFFFAQQKNKSLANKVYISFNTAKKLFGLKNGLNAISIKTADDKTENYVQKVLYKEIHKLNNQNKDNNIKIFNWKNTNKDILNAIHLEKQATFFILIILVILAAFNITSILSLYIYEKTREIAILKTIGITNKNLQNIFIMLALFISIISILLGIFLGFIISTYLNNIIWFLSNLLQYNLSFSTSYSPKLITIFMIFDIIKIMFITFIACVLFTYLISKKVSQIEIVAQLNCD